MLWIWIACNTNTPSFVEPKIVNTVEVTKDDLEDKPQKTSTDNYIANLSNVEQALLLSNLKTQFKRPQILEKYNNSLYTIHPKQTLARGMWELYKENSNLFYTDIEAQELFTSNFFQEASLPQLKETSFCYSGGFIKDEHFITYKSLYRWRQYVLPNSNLYVEIHYNQVNVFLIEEDTLIPVFLLLHDQTQPVLSISISPDQTEILILLQQSIIKFPLNTSTFRIHRINQNVKIYPFMETNIQDVQWTTDGIFVYSSNQIYQFMEEQGLIISNHNIVKDPILCSSNISSTDEIFNERISIEDSIESKLRMMSSIPTPTDSKIEGTIHNSTFSLPWSITTNESFFAWEKNRSISVLLRETYYTTLAKNGISSFIYKDKTITIPDTSVTYNQYLYDTDKSRLVQFLGKVYILHPNDDLSALSFPVTKNAFIEDNLVWSCGSDGCDYALSDANTTTHLDYHIPLSLNERLFVLYSMTQNKLSIREKSTAKELLTIDRPSVFPLDVHMSLDEKWLFIELPESIQVYNMLDGALIANCGMTNNSTETCTFGQLRQWSFPFGELLGEILQDDNNYSAYPDVIWEFNAIPDHVVMSNAYKVTIDYNDKSDIPKRKLDLHDKSIRYYQYDRSGSKTLVQYENNVIQIPTPSYHSANFQGAIRDTSMWKKIHKCEQFSEESVFSTVYTAFKLDQTKQLSKIIERDSPLFFNPIIRQFWYEDFVSYGTYCTNINPDISFKINTLAIPSKMAIYANQNLPSYEEYYQIKNRYSLERICQKTLEIVHVTPIEQNFDSVFLPSGLENKYCNGQ